ncbi:hypothetical protein [Flavobacterium sp. CS20]|jgi:hypothetical protein|uniref:hypothetical protein n=1 Tax=Flavobacterium sp. CS20 TaxID=2775246 RepID=UPI001B3A2D75|nr:hypothetical protein [Flavobacterium sp. CS20]QTY28053.1 hypothetical protein IGB25_06070 [Flavobacterium sp. CS20]
MKTEHDISQLIDKYLEGKTHIEEEQLLAQYFINNKVKPEWQVYQNMFSYFENSKTAKPQQSFKPKAKKSFKPFYKYVAILLVCLAGAWFYNHRNSTKDLGTYDDPELALQETIKVFELIGSHINSNTKDIQNLSTLEEIKTKYIDKLKP